MNKRHPITAFYVEALILILAFVGIILILTQVFGAGQALSSDADQLTRAVGMAQNTAEAVAAAEDFDDLSDMLEEGKVGGSADPDGIWNYYDKDGSPSEDGVYHVWTTWEPEPKGDGELVRSRITVQYGDEEEPIYTLETAKYREEGSE